MSDDEFDTLDCESRGGVTKTGRNEHGESIDDQDSNNNSMVVRLSDGERIHLYTGDIESTAAEALADGYDEEELSADVLHAGHHGGTLHSVAFLDKVDPAVVIVSSELNGRYDRPDPRLLERGARRGISVAWTAALSRDIGDRELEAAVDGDTQYDAWKLLKLRCVRRDERESTRDSLDETGEIVVAEYPLDRAAVDACDSGTEERAGEWGISADEMTGVRESPETEASGPFGDIPGVGEVKRAALRGAGIGSREERLGGG